MLCQRRREIAAQQRDRIVRDKVESARGSKTGYSSTFITVIRRAPGRMYAGRLY
jgi:hypothetical protein